MAKGFEINLTPQNDEWIKLIPNSPQNMDIVLNKLIESAINDGLLLEIIAQSLTVADLLKFKTMYSKMQLKRVEYMADLEITPHHIERKKVVQTQIIETDTEEIVPEEIVQKPAPTKAKKPAHGFSEDSF